jgi:hypothetical protein
MFDCSFWQANPLVFQQLCQKIYAFIWAKILNDVKLIMKDIPTNFQVIWSSFSWGANLEIRVH